MLQSYRLQAEIWTLVEELTRQFPQIGCELFAEDRIYLYQTSPESMLHQQMSHCEFTDFSAFHTRSRVGQPNTLRQVRAAYAGMLEHYAVASSTPTFLEVTHTRANKGEALRLLKGALHARRAYAIGDSGNDLAMLQAAEFRVCAGQCRCGDPAVRTLRGEPQHGGCHLRRPLHECNRWNADRTEKSAGQGGFFHRL